MLPSRVLCGILSLALAGAVAAEEPPAAAPPPTVDAPVMDTVLVTGEQPGPGLWKVSKGDHVLWILGTWSPLPAGMSWRSKQAEELIAQSQEVLTTPRANVEIGFFRRLTLLPSLIGVRKNADGDKLEDVLPPDLYARWQVLKERYIGRDKGIERQRPMFAARELYRKAIAKSGLSLKNDAQSLVREIAKQHGVKVEEVNVEIEVDDPRQAIREFKSSPREADVACLRATMDRLETDLAAMKQRANAWASGDLESLRNLPYVDQTRTCISGVASAPGLRERIAAAQARVAEEWTRAAENALARNASTFAVLPMEELTKNDGWLSRLGAKGYAVEAPE
ncbi:TraB/GumN family protein [Dokdonella sp.]|uniref:TraB/GumN family protein n=1 Tax=Dokdonella sp. TaxID=2291710 RepID=UPI001AFFE92F|nr:TraB/GumN family protein [Dokdonella sp.]MBO9664111.1 TraB/GumN family protein [Dokdonella sp.]